MRLFLAIPLPPPVKNACFEARNDYPSHTRVNWSNPDNLHLTVVFIGEIPDENLPDVQEKIATEARRHAPFVLQFDHYETVRKKGRPTMVWGTGRSSPAFATLAQDLYKALNIVLKHPPTLHVTLARIKDDTLPLPPFPDGGDLQAEPFTVEAVELWKADLRPGGALYTALGHYPLADAAPA